MKMKREPGNGRYINDVITFYELIQDGYKIELESLKKAGDKKGLKELTEKLTTVEDFLIHLNTIKQHIKSYYILKNKIPDFIWTKSPKEAKDK